MSVATSTAIALAGGLAAAGGVTSAVLGSKASKSAAETQAQAAQSSIDEQKRQFDITQANEAPWLQSGQVSLQQLMAGLQPGGELSTPYSGTFTPPAAFTPPSAFTAPTLAEAENQPGYKFTQQAGLQGIEHAASAAGGVFSTGTLGQEAKFSQDLATQNYGNVLAQDQGIYQQNYANAFANSQNQYSQALQNFQTNFNAYNTNQTNLYNKLAGTSGAGQTAATQLGTIGGSTAANIGNTLTTQGADRAAGTVGSANAINSGIANITNGVNSGLSQLSLAQLMNLTNRSGIDASLGGPNATLVPPNSYGS